MSHDINLQIRDNLQETYRDVYTDEALSALSAVNSTKETP